MKLNRTILIKLKYDIQILFKKLLILDFRANTAFLKRRKGKVRFVFTIYRSLVNILLHNCFRIICKILYYYCGLFQILHVGSQIEIFCQTLMEVSTNFGKEKSRKFITKVVCKHQRIIKMSKNIEVMFQYISLGQFLSNMVVIGFISFILAVVSKFNSNILHLL